MNDSLEENEQKEVLVADHTIQDSKINPLQDRHDRKGTSIAVKKINVSFNGVSAVSNASFEIAPGERVGIIGNNGAGKSTLCDVMSGLTTPDTGSVKINEIDVSKFSVIKRAKLGMRRVFQHPALFSDLSIEENIIVGTPPSKGDGLIPSLFTPRLFYKERFNTARQIMEYCNIEIDSTTPIDQLPYGTKKRIELGRALMGNPRILILDEPAASMDEQERAHYAQVILDYAETFSTTLIIVEHDINFIKATCERAIVIDAGEIIADGEVLDVLRNEEVMNRYLGLGQ